MRRVPGTGGFAWTQQEDNFLLRHMRSGKMSQADIARLFAKDPPVTLAQPRTLASIGTRLGILSKRMKEQGGG